MCLGYFVQLLQNGFTELSESGMVVPSAKLEQCFEMKDFLSVPTPRFILR
jgi:hypothetical protein